MKPHLVIFYTERGVISARYFFKNVPPSLNDIKEMQKDLQKLAQLKEEPVIVNWLPVVVNE